MGIKGSTYERIAEILAEAGSAAQRRLAAQQQKGSKGLNIDVGGTGGEREPFVPGKLKRTGLNLGSYNQGMIDHLKRKARGWKPKPRERFQLPTAAELGTANKINAPHKGYPDYTADRPKTPEEEKPRPTPRPRPIGPPDPKPVQPLLPYPDPEDSETERRTRKGKLTHLAEPTRGLPPEVAYRRGQIEKRVPRKLLATNPTGEQNWLDKYTRYVAGGRKGEAPAISPVHKYGSKIPVLGKMFKNIQSRVQADVEELHPGRFSSLRGYKPTKDTRGQSALSRGLFQGASRISRLLGRGDDPDNRRTRSGKMSHAMGRDERQLLGKRGHLPARKKASVKPGGKDIGLGAGVPTITGLPHTKTKEGGLEKQTQQIVDPNDLGAQLGLGAGGPKKEKEPGRHAASRAERDAVDPQETLRQGTLPFSQNKKKPIPQEKKKPTQGTLWGEHREIPNSYGILVVEIYKRYQNHYNKKEK